MSKTLDEVATAWAEDADERLVAHVKREVEAGNLHWRWDPEVDGVAGLVLTASPNRAMVVVYGDGDFECDDVAFEVALAEAEEGR